MKNSGNEKIFKIFLFVLIAVVVLGIGYAAASSIHLLFNGTVSVAPDQSRFKVQFVSAQRIKGSPGAGGTAIVDYYDKTLAHFTISGLTKVGDYAQATYLVKNNSNKIGADISLEITNSNPEYFKVTQSIDNNILQAGETTLATVKVEIIKSPIDNAVSTDVSTKLISNPLDNASATGGTPKSTENPGSGYAYYIGDNINLNSQLPQDNIYDNYNDAIQNHGYPMFIQDKYVNGITKGLDVGYIRNDELYYLKGYIKESNLDEKPVFESNKEVLLTSFGTENCTISDRKVECKDPDNNDFGSANTDGYVYIIIYGDSTKRCYVNAGGYSGCDQW